MNAVDALLNLSYYAPYGLLFYGLIVQNITYMQFLFIAFFAWPMLQSALHTCTRFFIDAFFTASKRLSAFFNAQSQVANARWLEPEYIPSKRKGVRLTITANQYDCRYEGLELELQPNCINVIEGRNGVGKSTLFGLLQGLFLNSGQSSITVEGATEGGILGLAQDAWRPRMSVNAYAYQGTGHKDLQRYLDFGLNLDALRLYTPTSLRGQADQAAFVRMSKLGYLDCDLKLDALGLYRVGGRDVATLSGGQAAKAAFVRMSNLVTRSSCHKVLFLIDESLRSIDASSAAHVLKQLISHCRSCNITPVVLMISHNVTIEGAHKITLYQDRTGVIRQGREPGELNTLDKKVLL